MIVDLILFMEEVYDGYLSDESISVDTVRDTERAPARSRDTGGDSAGIISS